MGRYVGIHLAAFAVADAAKAHRRLARSGFRMRALIDMARPVETVAEPGTAAFTLARLTPGEMPEGRIQFLTHHTEAMVWQPRWLSHPNGALALASIMIAVLDPDEAALRFTRFTGRSARAATLGQIIDLDRGRIDLVRSEAFAQLLPEVMIRALPFIGAYTIVVKSLDAVESIFAKANLPTRRMGQALVAPFPACSAKAPGYSRKPLSLWFDSGRSPSPRGRRNVTPMPGRRVAAADGRGRKRRSQGTCRRSATPSETA